MNTVYLVGEFLFDQCRFYGIYSTKELAEEAAGEAGEGYSVKEVKIDEPFGE